MHFHTVSVNFECISVWFLSVYWIIVFFFSYYSDSRELRQDEEDEMSYEVGFQLMTKEGRIFCGSEKLCFNNLCSFEYFVIYNTTLIVEIPLHTSPLVQSTVSNWKAHLCVSNLQCLNSFSITKQQKEIIKI